MVTPSEEELIQIKPLLLAHEAAMASQQLCLNTAGLQQTFELMLKLVREMQGIYARRVELTNNALGQLFQDIYKTGWLENCPRTCAG